MKGVDFRKTRHGGSYGNARSARVMLTILRPLNESWIDFHDLIKSITRDTARWITNTGHSCLGMSAGYACHGELVIRFRASCTNRQARAVTSPWPPTHRGHSPNTNTSRHQALSSAKSSRRETVSALRQGLSPPKLAGGDITRTKTLESEEKETNEILRHREISPRPSSKFLKAWSDVAMVLSGTSAHATDMWNQCVA